MMILDYDPQSLNLKGTHTEERKQSILLCSASYKVSEESGASPLDGAERGQQSGQKSMNGASDKDLWYVTSFSSLPGLLQHPPRLCKRVYLVFRV